MKLLFRQKNFIYLLSGRSLLTMALQVQAVIIGWHIYELKKQAYLLGILGLVEAVPAIAGALIAGPVVDHSRPARILRWSILIMLATMILAWLAVFIPEIHREWMSTDTEIFILFATIFMSGAARSFVSPAAFSLLPQLLDRSLIPQAAALNSSTFTLAQIVGPALGGVSFAFGSLAWTFAIPVGLCALALSPTFMWSADVLEIGVPPHIRRTESVFTSLQAGWQFLWEQKVLLSIMSLDMLSVLFGGAVAVLPIFADQVFHVGASGLGFLRAAPAVGAALTSLILAVYPLREATGNRLMFVIAAFGACMIAFGLNTNFYLALALLFASGAFDGVNMVLRGTMNQLLTPVAMRGRVSALSSVFITSSNELGAFESGLAASFMGLIPSVVFGGIMTLVVVGSIRIFVPSLSQTRIPVKGKNT